MPSLNSHILGKMGDRIHHVRLCLCVCVSVFLRTCMLYSASAPARWQWWSIVIITWAECKVALWLDPVNRRSSVSRFCVRGNVCVRACHWMRFSPCSSALHTDMAILAGPLCKQMASAGRFSEGWRLYLVASARGVMVAADSADESVSFHLHSDPPRPPPKQNQNQNK